jgi:hypothetical protein
MSGILITEGTSLNVAADTVGTTNYQKVKLDIGAAGASSLFTGTLGAVTNLAGGTVTNQLAGTIETVSQLPPGYFGTTVTTGTNTLGTIKAAIGAGTSIYVTDLIISVGAGTTDVVLGNGGTSTPLMGTSTFTAFGGLVSNFRVPLQTTAGSALVYKQSGTITLTITAVGFVK